MHRGYLFFRTAAWDKQTVVYRYGDGTVYIKRICHKQVVYRVDRAGGGVFYRKNAVVKLPLIYFNEKVIPTWVEIKLCARKDP